ncbi:MAG: hypothetical protein GX102_12895 [Porphyromonadaceae bacterium]|jgi:hypothetical protein|nr:hypothetical protein [Porphyromonadaceae bacterium]
MFICLSLAIICLSSVFLVSCDNTFYEPNNTESTTHNNDISESFTEFETNDFEKISYNQIKQDNRVGVLSRSCQIGQYIIFTDLGKYTNKDGNYDLIRMSNDGSDHQIIYSSDKFIGNVQIVDENKIAFSVLRFAEPELLVYDYYYYDLKTSQVEAITENPTNDKNAYFTNPVWVDGNMLFEMYVNKKGDQSESVNSIKHYLYCKNKNKGVVLLTKDLSDYYINNNLVYYIENGGDFYHMCNLNGSDIRRSDISSNQRIYGNYLIDFSSEKPLFTNSISNTQTQMSINLPIYNVIGWDDSYMYFNLYDGIYRVAFKDNEIEQISDKTTSELDIYSNCVIFTINESKTSVSEYRPYIAYFGSILSQKLY